MAAMRPTLSSLFQAGKNVIPRPVAKNLLAKIPPLFTESPLFSYSNPQENPNTHKYDPKKYYGKMPDAFVGFRDNGLDALRTRCLDGITTILPYSDPKDPHLTQLHTYLCGTPVMYGDTNFDPAIHPKKISGLVLHPGSPKSLFIWRGTVNPHLGHGMLHAINKWEEFCLLEKYAPGCMLPLCRASDLADYQPLLQKTKIEELCSTIRENSGIEKFLENFLNHLKKIYPQGAYLKHQLGCFTADGGTMLATHSAHPAALTNVFIREFQKIQNKDIDNIRKQLLNLPNNSALIVFELLFAPENVLISPQIPLKKTEQGYPLEFRVDALDFEPCAVWPRYPTTEYYPREAKAAAALIQSLRNKMPLECRYFSFGADVAFDEQGNARLVELNPGGDSGFLKLALQYQVFISNLTGKSTSLIHTIKQVVNQPLSVQRAFLLGLNQTLLAHPEITDTEEVAIYIRNWHLDQWRQQAPHYRCAASISKNMRAIFTEALNERGIRTKSLVESTEQYFDRCSVFCNQSTSHFSMR